MYKYATSPAFRLVLDADSRSADCACTHLQMTFQYMTLGSHDVIMNCYNDISNYTLTFFVFAYHQCFSNDPIFDDQYRRVSLCF
jgi:hypothetical protein